jgi:hypothetical protein
MSEVEQRRDTGRDARGRAMQGAIADARGRATQGAVAEAARLAKARRNAWLLGGVALFFYVGYMAWMFVRGSGG